LSNVADRHLSGAAYPNNKGVAPLDWQRLVLRQFPLKSAQALAKP
jgi:hypothetical protein